VRKSSQHYAKEAARYHTNLNVYYCCISLLENGHLYEGEDAEEIIKLCKMKAQECLRRYDAAMAKIKDRQ